MPAMSDAEYGSGNGLPMARFKVSAERHAPPPDEDADPNDEEVDVTAPEVVLMRRCDPKDLADEGFDSW